MRPDERNRPATCLQTAKNGRLFAYRPHNALTVHDNGTMSVNQPQIPTLVYTQICLSPCVNTLLYWRYGSLFALNALSILRC